MLYLPLYAVYLLPKYLGEEKADGFKLAVRKVQFAVKLVVPSRVLLAAGLPCGGFWPAISSAGLPSCKPF